MVMGKSNIDTVTVSNTPQAFLERVNNTYTEYTRFAETQFKRYPLAKTNWTAY